MPLFSSFLTRRLIASVIIIAILAGSFSFVAFPRKAEASVPILCDPFLDFNCVKEEILDLIVSALVRTVVQSFTQMIANWITGNSGKDVNFFQNFIYL